MVTDDTQLLDVDIDKHIYSRCVVVVHLPCIPRCPEFDPRLLQSAVRDSKSWSRLHMTY